MNFDSSTLKARKDNQNDINFFFLLLDHPLKSGNYPPIVRHPGTCTFQRSQPACTFSLLCYLAGGTPIEACDGDISVTCCILHDVHNNKKVFPTHSTSSQSTATNVESNAPSSTPTFKSSFSSSQLSSSSPYSARHDYPSNYEEFNSVRRSRPLSLFGKERQSRNYISDDSECEYQFCNKTFIAL